MIFITVFFPLDFVFSANRFFDAIVLDNLKLFLEEKKIIFLN